MHLKPKHKMTHKELVEEFISWAGMDSEEFRRAAVKEIFDLRKKLVDSNSLSLEVAASLAESGTFQIECSGLEAAGVVRRTRNAIASAIRKKIDSSSLSFNTPEPSEFIETLEITVRLKGCKGEYLAIKVMTQLQADHGDGDFFRKHVTWLQEKARAAWDKKFPKGAVPVVKANEPCSNFCEQCGDCLDCYGEDPCGMGGSH